MAEFDLVIRGGQVVDGTGADPVDADVGLVGSRIAAIGKLSAGREEIDARGKLVTPGFVDIHTHYDAQAVWDDHMAPSSHHGVTTAVMGNCGVGFAPCKPADRERLIELMEGVEDIPGAVMHEGLKWEWESFAGYLAALERRRRDIDLCALLPHAAVRVFVLGDRAIALENANQGDIAQMREIARQAMEAGAFGFSTSRSLSHKTLKGDPTPTLRAQEDELTGIAMGMRDAGSGMLGDRVGVVAGSQRGIRHAAPGDRGVRPSVRVHPVAAALPAGGLARPAGACRPGGARRRADPPRGCAAGNRPAAGSNRKPESILGLPVLYGDYAPSARGAGPADAGPCAAGRITTEDPKEGNTFPLFHRMSFEYMFRFGNPGNYLPEMPESIAAIAVRDGRTPQEVAYDLMLEDEGRAFIYMTLGNYAYGDLSMCETVLDNRNCIMGLGDGGAHVAFILDAGYQTWLLTHWGKTRQRWSMPELIRRLTSDTAGAAGLHDRGVLAPGKKADLNVIDWDRLGAGQPYVVHDLPAGGKRLMQAVHGYDATIVSGEVTFRNGEATGVLPGKLVRGPQAA